MRKKEQKVDGNIRILGRPSKIGKFKMLLNFNFVNPSAFNILLKH